MRRTIRLESADAPTQPWFGSRIRFPLRPGDTGGKLAVHWACAPRGSAAPPHCHGGEDELFYVLTGSLTLETPGSVAVLNPGDLALVPRGLAHRASHPDADSTVLVGLSPGIQQGAFAAIAGDSAQSAGALAAEMAIYDVHILDAVVAYRHPLAPDPKALKIVRADEGERFWMAGDEYTLKLAGEDTDGRFCVLHFRIPPGGGPLVHAHTHDDEVFYILRGRPSFYAGGEVVRGSPGDTVVLPRGIPHAFRNDTAEEIEFLTLTAPAGAPFGFDRMVRAAAVPARRGEPVPPRSDEDKARIIAAADRFGVRLHPEIKW